mgnify:CR=1 FL=1
MNITDQRQILSQQGMSVMLQAQAQLDQLVHGMITAINDTLCPNTTLGELTGNTAIPYRNR